LPPGQPHEGNVFLSVLLSAAVYLTPKKGLSQAAISWLMGQTFNFFEADEPLTGGAFCTSDPKN